jgi:hypothetical protein
VTIGCDQAAARVTVTTSATLDPSCAYTGGFDVVASNVVLDCRGALLQRASGSASLGIVVRTPVDEDLADVTIRHCRVDGFLNDIKITRQGVQSLAPGHEYDHHLRHVVVEDSTLTDSAGVGLYVDPYVTDTVIRRTTIARAGSTGIYLDEGSRRATVTDNIVVGNGFVENGPGGTNTNVGGVDVRYWGPGREAIAVDGSGDNLIAGNWLVGNAAGGVFLYTNCGEYVHQDPASWLEHRFGAEHNRVERNVIIGGETGVWVGSRMGENVYPMDCSDPPYVSGPLQAITLDRAAHNRIRGNAIAVAHFGVRVEDDDTFVAGNRFFGSTPDIDAIVVGTPYRAAVLGRPVTHTRLDGNDSEIVGNPSPYRWVEGVRDLVAVHNRADGAAAGICGAPSIPRGPFVMVYAVALQDPTLPPVPPPPYTVPSLGVLAPCP